MAKLVDQDEVIRALRRFVTRRVGRIATIGGVSTTTVRRVLAHPEDGPARRTGIRAARANLVLRRALVKRLATTVVVRGTRRVPAFPTCASIKLEVRKRLGMKVSVETIRLDLHKVGLRSYVRPKIPYCTSVDRIPFVTRMLALPNSKLKKIIFSDEHFVSVNDHGPLRMWTGRKGGDVEKDVVPSARLKRYPNTDNTMSYE